MQAVEATIDAAEVALEELCSAPLQRPCGGRATEGRLPPGIAPLELPGLPRSPGVLKTVNTSTVTPTRQQKNTHRY